MKRNTKIAAGVGTALLAAGAAAGYYFYASSDAKKNRRIAIAWASDLKDDVLKEARKLKMLNKQSLTAAIDKIAALYETARNIDHRDMQRAVGELRGHWQDILKEVGSGSSGSRARTKSSGRKKTAARAS